MRYFCHAQLFEITRANKIEIPYFATIVPKRLSCARIRGRNSSNFLSRAPLTNPYSHSLLRRCPTSRDFVPWRFLDAGQLSVRSLLVAGVQKPAQQATSITDGGSVSGDRKLKESTPRLARGRPQPAPVGIDDQTADRESHTHAAGFGGEEGGEQPVRILGGDPDAAIRHTYQHLLCLVLPRSDHQFARPIRDRLHRFNAIHHQVNDHLLQLDPITKDHG